VSSPADAAISHSAFYVGRVLHERYQPKNHRFSYPMYMTALDLDEVDYMDRQFWWFSVSRWAPLQLRLSDYFKGCKEFFDEKDGGTDALRLKQRVVDLCESLGADVEGCDRVVMMAQLRCFGIYFSPINLFFLYRGGRCYKMLVEVSNTPWNQRHCYLVDIDNPSPSRKDFHVSPFMNLDMEYRWRIRSPASSTLVSIENWREQRLFKAVFAAKRQEMNPKNVAKVLLRWPIASLSILRKIYWQAFKLFLKGIKYVPYRQERQTKREN
jgi:DUF1365 family protein